MSCGVGLKGGRNALLQNPSQPHLSIIYACKLSKIVVDDKTLEIRFRNRPAMGYFGLASIVMVE